MNCLANSTWKR